MQPFLRKNRRLSTVCTCNPGRLHGLSWNGCGGSLPLLHGLHRRLAARRWLRQLVVVQDHAARQGCSMSSRLSNLWVLSTSAMRPLNLSTMPLVLGVLGFVSRCSMPSAWHNSSNSWLPLAWRSPLANSRSVNSLPLSVSNLLILIGQALCNVFRKDCALAAVLLALSCTNTHRVARSMATNR